MRIAISGPQSTGKPTLAGELAGSIPNARMEPEPFRVLKDRLGLVSGADSMTPEQELALIEHSQDRMNALRAGETVIFDRCALDALAHARVAAETGNPAFTADWINRLNSAAMSALRPLDLIVVVPLSEDLPLVEDGVRSTNPGYRKAVDEMIRRLAGGFPNVLEVGGDTGERVKDILGRVDPNGLYRS